MITNEEIRQQLRDAGYTEQTLYHRPVLLPDGGTLSHWFKPGAFIELEEYPDRAPRVFNAAGRRVAIGPDDIPVGS